MVSKYKGSGWHGESYRHSLASKGIKTKFKRGYKKFKEWNREFTENVTATIPTGKFTPRLRSMFTDGFPFIDYLKKTGWKVRLREGDKYLSDQHVEAWRGKERLRLLVVEDNQLALELAWIHPLTFNRIKNKFKYVRKLD